MILDLVEVAVATSVDCRNLQIAAGFLQVTGINPDIVEQSVVIGRSTLPKITLELVAVATMLFPLVAVPVESAPST